MAQRLFEGFIPKPGEKAFIAGQNGSGKTAFALWLMVRIPIAPIFVYDTKIEPKFDKLPNNRVIHAVDEMQEAFEDEKVDYIIVRPPEDMLGNPRELDEYLWYQYLHCHGTVAYIDEGMTFHTPTGHAFKGLLSLMQRGRSKGIITIVSSQQPVRISRSIKTEMNKAYIFYLQSKDNRKAIDDVIPDFSTLPVPRIHAFYYWETGMRQAVLFEPIKLDPAFDTGYTDASAVEASNSPDEPSANTSSTTEKPPTKHVWV